MPSSALRSSWIAYRAEALRGVGCVYPAYAQNRFVGALAKALREADPAARTTILERDLGILYSPANLAAMVTHRYPAAPASKPFHRTIAGAIESFFCARPHAAITSLLPVVEGMLRRLADAAAGTTDASGKNDLKNKLCATLDRLIAKGDALGDDAAIERADMLRVVRDFFATEFWADPSQTTTVHRVHRNAILHGRYGEEEFGSALDFYRLVCVVDVLTFIRTFQCSGVSALAPDRSPASEALAAYWMVLRAIAAKRPLG